MRHLVSRNAFVMPAFAKADPSRPLTNIDGRKPPSIQTSGPSLAVEVIAMSPSCGTKGMLQRVSLTPQGRLRTVCFGEKALLVFPKIQMKNSPGTWV
jgi:hypothetical protein